MDSILVIGSYNVGLTVLGPHIPRVGETVMGEKFDMGPGGKGSNQAVTIARLGGTVHFLAKVGNDIFGREAIELFRREGIDVGTIRTDPDTHTGVGVILVDHQGRNCIGVVLGANLRLTRSDIDAAEELFKRCRYLLLQMEIDLDVVHYAIDKAKRAGMTVILNPAPAHPIESEYLRKVDIITPNEVEAGILTGVEITDQATAYQAGERLLSQGVRQVIVTLGSQGCIYMDRQQRRHYEPLSVPVVDTTGAGDAFNGGLTYALAAGKTIEDAIIYGTKVAACSIMHVGVVPGLPTAEQVNQQFDK